MAKHKIEMNVKTATGHDQLMPKTEADIVLLASTISGLSATTVQAAIQELHTNKLASSAAAASATKLATARTINGVSFDGTANITITAAANGGTSAACSGNAATATTATNVSGGTVSGTTGTFSGVLKTTNTTAASSTTTGALIVGGGAGIAGSLYATNVYGAVWNDYAEFRQSRQDVRPGYVVGEIAGDYVALCNKRLDTTAMVVSDTFGFAIGEQKKEGEYSLPIAVSGRVLVYTDKHSSHFKIGDVVCSGKNGRVSKMKWWERILFPHAAIGVVSSIPEYKTWGTGNVRVNNRIWIKVK